MSKVKGTAAEDGMLADTDLVKRNNILFTVAFAECYQIRNTYNVFLCLVVEQSAIFYCIYYIKDVFL